MQKKIPVIYLTRAACIAAIYFTLTYFLAPLSYGPIQIRFAEALTLLPVIFPEAIAGLAIGCLLANLFGLGMLDVIFGSLTTLVAAVLTYLLRKKPFIAALPPVILNALIIPVVIIFSAEEVVMAAYWGIAGSILLSQAIIIYLLGIPLTQTLKKTLFFNKNAYENNKNNSDSEKFGDKSD